eukprot:gene16309-biopygen15811
MRGLVAEPRTARRRSLPPPHPTPTAPGSRAASSRKARPASAARRRRMHVPARARWRRWACGGRAEQRLRGIGSACPVPPSGVTGQARATPAPCPRHARATRGNKKMLIARATPAPRPRHCPVTPGVRGGGGCIFGGGGGGSPSCPRAAEFSGRRGDKCNQMLNSGEFSGPLAKRPRKGPMKRFGPRYGALVHGPCVWERGPSQCSSPDVGRTMEFKET